MVFRNSTTAADGDSEITPPPRGVFVHVSSSSCSIILLLCTVQVRVVSSAVATVAATTATSAAVTTSDSGLLDRRPLVGALNIRSFTLGAATCRPSCRQRRERAPPPLCYCCCCRRSPSLTSPRPLPSTSPPQPRLSPPAPKISPRPSPETPPTTGCRPTSVYHRRRSLHRRFVYIYIYIRSFWRAHGVIPLSWLHLTRVKRTAIWRLT